MNGLLKWASTSYAHLIECLYPATEWQAQPKGEGGLDRSQNESLYPATEWQAQPKGEGVLTVAKMNHFTQWLSDRFPQQSPNKVCR